MKAADSCLPCMSNSALWLHAREQTLDNLQQYIKVCDHSSFQRSVAKNRLIDRCVGWRLS
jgi:hypothetical protein